MACAACRLQQSEVAFQQEAHIVQKVDNRNEVALASPNWSLGKVALKLAANFQTDCQIRFTSSLWPFLFTSVPPAPAEESNPLLCSQRGVQGVYGRSSWIWICLKSVCLESGSSVSIWPRRCVPRASREIIKPLKPRPLPHCPPDSLTEGSCSGLDRKDGRHSGTRWLKSATSHFGRCFASRSTPSLRLKLLCAS